MLAHFLADYTILAGARIIEAKAKGGPIALIAWHAVIHGFLVLPLLYLTASSPAAALIAAAAIVVTHFAIDTGRSRLGLRYATLGDPSGKPFWTALGFDQFLHSLVLVWATWYVLS